MTDDASSANAPRAGAKRWMRAVRQRLLETLPLVATVLLVGSLLLPADEEQTALAWQSYSVESLRTAAREQRPAIVDVSASWCAPCVAMERTTFRDPAVHALAQSFTLLRADLTSSDAGARTDLAWLNVTSIPTILVFDRAGREVRRLVGFTSHAVLTQALERAAAEGNVSVATSRRLP